VLGSLVLLVTDSDCVSNKHIYIYIYIYTFPGDVFAVIAESRQYVAESFLHLCDELTSAGWHVTPVLLAADEWRAQWTLKQQLQQQHTDDGYKKLY